MNRAPTIQFLTSPASRKRRHDEISDSESPRPTPDQPSPAGNSQSSVPQLPPLPTIRRPRDGYDDRRPIMSTGLPPPPPSYMPRRPQRNVIDLTEEDHGVLRPPHTPEDRPPERSQTGATRPPRFGRNIMADVVDLEQGPTTSIQQSSPDVQWLGSISREAGSRSVNPAAIFPQYDGPSRPMLSDDARFLPSSDSRPRQPPTHRPLPNSLPSEVAWRARDLFGAFHQAMRPFWIGERPSQGIDLTHLDVTFVGLDRFEPQRTPASPKYEAPPAPSKGFTRAVGKDDVVVCPNCDHELGSGDEPLRRQIWVARPCGHVYCGLCATNRAVSRGKKATPVKTKPFAKCVVAGCGKPVSSPKTMIQVYL
ncbi:hypothetical protein LOZ58_005104 [Ophidiomyces ophidiicola]|nr:hypothetical protein LOZ58_005104 [Ophidiomyces ophidiicola]